MPQDKSTDEVRTAGMKFPGNPKLYRRIANWSTVGILVWLYGGTALVQLWWLGHTWVFKWQSILVGVLFGIWYARASYNWMMRLDAQFGRGSSWMLRDRNVKLPELKD